MKYFPSSSSLQDTWSHPGAFSYGEPVRVTDIAAYLNGQTQRHPGLGYLAEQGLIEQERYGPVKLTARGKNYAGW